MIDEAIADTGDEFLSEDCWGENRILNISA